ncbi:MAG: hypothetical protein ACREQ5_14485, partial [Candidatus Dormibacteria bacterium]
HMNMTVRAGSNSTCCPSISTKLNASDMHFPLGVGAQWLGHRTLHRCVADSANPHHDEDKVT